MTGPETIEALVERSSLGTPGAKLLRAAAFRSVVHAVLARVGRSADQSNPR
jgi:hypothetical protein